MKQKEKLKDKISTTMKEFLEEAKKNLVMVEKEQEQWGSIEICLNTDHFYPADSILGIVHLSLKQDVSTE